LWGKDDHAIEYNYVELKDFPHKWTSNETGNWDTEGTPGGGYDLKSQGGGQELLIKGLVAPLSFIYQADIRLEAENAAAGIIFQKQTGAPAGTSAYAVYLDTTLTSDLIRFYRLEDSGVQSVMSQTSTETLDVGVTYHVKLLVSGGDMALYLSDTPNKPYTYRRVLAGSDTNSIIYSMGGVGFWQPGGTPQTGLSVRYDNVTFGETSPFYITDPATGGTGYAIASGASYSTIQSAIDSASPGDWLEFAAGTYDIGTEVVDLADGVSMVCADPGNCLIRGSGDVVIVTLGVNTVEGFAISGIFKQNTGTPSMV
jgi:hypothetical protein